MSATEHWNEMVRVEHAQSDSMRKEDPPADSWSNFAQQFRADPRRIDDPLVNYLRQLVTPEQVVLDVGAGGGRLALPLALEAQKVFAVEPSPSMCRVLREVASEFNVPNVEVIESGWLDAQAPQADLAICCHVLYVIQDIEAFVRKLEQHAKQVLVIVYQAPPQSQIYPLWEPMHGVPRSPLPSLPEFLEVLTQLGVEPDIHVVHTERNRGFESLEAAKDQLARRLYVTPNSAEMERLEELLPDVLEEKDGGFSIKGSVNLEPRVVSWQTGS
ncbi:MAG: class I SAM-dependent methyltransferase [Dehalococcoidia bacterium]|nr:class I SAM-dependent methyltransferase [Dehalococcoidia bacterium]